MTPVEFLREVEKNPGFIFFTRKLHKTISRAVPLIILIEMVPHVFCLFPNSNLSIQHTRVLVSTVSTTSKAGIESSMLYFSSIWGSWIR
jgi:hypothetical protein